MTGFESNNLFTDAGRIKLLLSALIASPEQGIELSDSYYWLDNNGIKDGKIQNTLLLLEQAEILKEKTGRLFISNQFKAETEKHSIENTLTTFVIGAIEDSVLESIFRSRFIYDTGQLAIKTNSVSPMLIEVRNLLINIGAVEQRDDLLICNSILEASLIEKGFHYFFEKDEKELSEDDLKVYLERNSVLGEQAESYALVYEKNRLKLSKLEPVLIAKSNVLAGYDIKSFDTEESKNYDRFIEVKYYNNNHFFISEHELEIATMYREKYWLYLVDTDSGKIECIQNPIVVLDNNQLWIKKSKIIEYTPARDSN